MACIWSRKGTSHTKGLVFIKTITIITETKGIQCVIAVIDFHTMQHDDYEVFCIPHIPGVHGFESKSKYNNGSIRNQNNGKWVPCSFLP